MKKIIKILNISLSILLIAVAIGIAYVAIPHFGNQALIVRSGSMEPNIPVGSVVVARPTGNYGINDVITFRSENNAKKYITHRITWLEKDDSGLVTYTTKGDANEENDNWTVTNSQIVGKVIFTAPYVGQFLTFVKSKNGFFTMIVIPAIFVMLLEAWNIFREIKKSHKKRQIEKPFEGFGYNTNSIVSSNKKWTYLKVTILFVVFSGIVAIPTTYAVLSDIEESSNNKFQAADVFPSPSISPTPEPAEGTIVINEISSNGASAIEWVEIYNGTSSEVDISGWKISDGNSEDIIPTSTPISANGYAVIVGSTSTVSIPGSAIAITLDNSTIGSGLNDTGDLVRLKNDSDLLIDEMSYGSNTSVFATPPPAPITGETLSRIPNGFDSDLASDWVVDAITSIGVSN